MITGFIGHVMSKFRLHPHSLPPRFNGKFKGLSFRNFEITKTKTPKSAVKFDRKLGGKNRTEDNLTD